LSTENIAAAYPVGRLDRSLLVVGGNKQMYDLIGERIYLPLYKIVSEKDVERLQSAVSVCDAPETEIVEECIHILNEEGKYDTFIIALRKAIDAVGYEFELQNVSSNVRKTEEMGERLGILRDFLTISGNLMFVYRHEDGWFQLFWLDYEQKVVACDMPLEQWERQTVHQGYVSGENLAAFKTFCASIKDVEQEQVHTFQGSILSQGKNVDTYRVKLLSRLYMGRKRTLGIWSVINEQTGNAVDDYIEGTYLDSMTKVLNKRGITEYAETAVASGAEVAVMMLDIDNFKDINDTYGHLFGDRVIMAVADVIKKVIGDHGVAGRVGGDEFMVILDSRGDEKKVRNYLRGIKMNVGTLFLDKLGGNKITCSIGVSRSQVDSDSFKVLYQIADKALYLAKQKGKDRYIIYSPEKHSELHLGEGDGDLSDIKEAFYSDNDLAAFNQSLSELALKGSGELLQLLAQTANVLRVPRVLVFWGEGRKVIGSFPQSLMKHKYDESCFEREEYMRLFRNDMLQIGNLNMMEYTVPEAYRLFRGNDVYSILQHYLRDAGGNIKGLVSVEECSQIRGFPKLAVQVFESMCKVLNAVLLREEEAGKKALDN